MEEANSTVTGTGSTPCQLLPLTLPLSVARTETLESPAYLPPSDFTAPVVDDAAAEVAQVISCDKQPVGTDAEPKNGMPMSSDEHQSPSTVASTATAAETLAVTSAATYEKLMPAPQAAAGKTSRFAASVRRKFTVSKTVLSSVAPPPVVVFSKLTAEAESPCETQNVADVGQVHIVDSAQPNDVTAICNADLSPSATESATDELMTSQQPTVTENDESVTNMTVTDETPRLRHVELSERVEEEVEIVECDENAQVSGSQHDRSVDNDAAVHQPEDSSSECEAVKATTLPSESGYQADDEESPLHQRSGADVTCEIVGASVSQESYPVNDVDNSECSNDVSLDDCTNDELPCDNASSDTLLEQVTDRVASCSTVDHATASVPSSEVSVKHDALQQNTECDNSPQTASAPAVQRTSPWQDTVDDNC